MSIKIQQNKNYYNISFSYHNSIGALHIKISLSNPLSSLSPKISLIHKVESCSLYIKIKMTPTILNNKPENAILSFSISLPNFNISIKDNILSINQYIGEDNTEKYQILMKYYCNSYIFDSYISEIRSLYTVPFKILCKNCIYNGKTIDESILFRNLENKVLFYKFNFDYNDSIDILSCHESHNSLYIPDNKLLNIININDFYIEVYNDNNECGVDLLKITEKDNFTCICKECKGTIGKINRKIVNNLIYNFYSLNYMLIIFEYNIKPNNEDSILNNNIFNNINNNKNSNLEVIINNQNQEYLGLSSKFILDKIINYILLNQIEGYSYKFKVSLIKANNNFITISLENKRHHLVKYTNSIIGVPCQFNSNDMNEYIIVKTIFSHEENTVFYDKEDECLYLTDKDYSDLMNQINQLIKTSLDLINEIDYDYSSLINNEKCFLYALSDLNSYI